MNWTYIPYGESFAVMDGDKRVCYVYAAFEDRPLEQAEEIAKSIASAQAELTAQRQRIAELEADVRMRQEAEASVCPEDVGIVEYVKSLKSALDAKSERLREAREFIARRVEHRPGCKSHWACTCDKDAFFRGLQ